MTATQVPPHAAARTARRPGRRILARRAGLLASNTDFRRLWTGSTAARYGASVTSVALPLLAVTVLHASTFQVGMLTAASWLPWMLIGLVAGAWVDRLPKRPIMLIADAASLLLFAAVPVVWALGGLSIGYLLGTALLTGTASVFFQTAAGVLLPRLVGKADQPEGNSKLHGSESAAQIAGAGTGGLIVQAAGAANALLVNALTFAVSLVSTWRIKDREPRRAPAPADGTQTGGGLRREIGEGLRTAFGDPYFRALTIFGGTSNLALMAYQAILVVFLVREVGLSSGAVGGLMTCGGIGGVLGAFAARRVAARIGTARALLLFELAVPSLALLIPLTGPNVAGLACFVIGYPSVAFGVVAGNVLAATFRQQYCPPRLLGRLATSSAFLNYGTIPLGALLGGALGEALGLRTALWITIALVPVSACQLVFSPIRRHRDLPTAPAGAPDADAAARAELRAARRVRRLQRLALGTDTARLELARVEATNAARRLMR